MITLPPIITIDGPSGVGKGSLCCELSKKLSWNILDSGAIYRVLALEALSCDIDIHHIKQLVELASNIHVTFMNTNNELGVFFRGKNVNNKICTEMIANLASKIAVFPEVRAILLQYQRNFHMFPGLIANGRDMGTVVFPTATLKVFLDASFEVRCKRRVKQLKKYGFDDNLNYILKKIKERDIRDCTRQVAPLIPSVDALIFNSTYYSINEIVCGILKCFYNSIFS